MKIKKYIGGYQRESFIGPRFRLSLQVLTQGFVPQPFAPGFPLYPASIKHLELYCAFTT
jgi:hypothetical protein